MKTRNRQQHRVHCGGVTIVADTLPSKPVQLAGDELLREYGFRLRRRPQDKGKPTVWERDGEFYTGPQALKIARREQAVTLRAFPKSTTGGA